MKERLFTTAFITSVISYGVFGFADYIRQGFVSTVFSLHWFLLVAVVFGTGLLLLPPVEQRKRKFVRATLRTVVSMFLFLLIFREGDVFGDLRGLLALVGAMAPWVINASLRATPKIDNV